MEISYIVILWLNHINLYECNLKLCFIQTLLCEHLSMRQTDANFLVKKRQTKCKMQNILLSGHLN